MIKKFVTAILVCFLNVTAFCQITALDPLFGNGGKISTDLGVSSRAVLETAIDANGQLIAAGYAAGSNSGVEVLHVVRYNLDGSLDSTFGNSGVLSTSYGFPGSLPTSLGLLVTAEGKIVVAAGRYMGSENNNDTALVYKFNSDGTPDLSFGNGGLVYGIPGFSYANNIATTSDGNFIVAGTGYFSGIRVYDCVITKITANGTIDTTFGSNGFATIDEGLQDLPTSLKILSDDRIIFGITSIEGAQYGQFVLAKLMANGQRDTSFGVDGLVRTSFDLPGCITDFKMVANNKIVACGTLGTFEDVSKIGLAKYNENGTLDSSFGIGGKKEYQNSNYAKITVHALALLADGKIITGGTAYNPEATDFLVSYNLMKFNADGSVNAAFGANGIVDSFGTQYSIINALQVYNNELYVSGSNYSSYGRFAVARYNIDSSLSTNNNTISQDLITAFPMPFSDKLVLRSSFQSTNKWTAVLYDSNGRKLQPLKQISENVEEASIILDMPETLSKGIYFLQISDGYASKSIKIVK